MIYCTEYQRCGLLGAFRKYHNGRLTDDVRHSRHKQSFREVAADFAKHVLCHTCEEAGRTKSGICEKALVICETHGGPCFLPNVGDGESAVGKSAFRLSIADEVRRAAGCDDPLHNRGFPNRFPAIFTVSGKLPRTRLGLKQAHTVFSRLSDSVRNLDSLLAPLSLTRISLTCQQGNIWEIMLAPYSGARESVYQLTIRGPCIYVTKWRELWNWTETSFSS